MSTGAAQTRTPTALFSDGLATASLGQYAEEQIMGLWDKRDDMTVHEADPYNAEPPRGALADRMFTPVDSFYGRNHGPIPLNDSQV